MKTAFLDANILLDFLDGNRRFHDAAVRALRLLIERDYGIVISEDILTTVYYVVKNKPAVLDFFAMIQSQWHIVSFGPIVIEEAIRLCKEDPALDLEDVLQALGARQARCDLIITNDTRFYRCGVETLHVEDFLAS
jgi:predicted nucleic acid-binding protein